MVFGSMSVQTPQQYKHDVAAAKEIARDLGMDEYEVLIEIYCLREHGFFVGCDFERKVLGNPWSEDAKKLTKKYLKKSPIPEFVFGMK